jgi:hypothetical protein
MQGPMNLLVDPNLHRIRTILPHNPRPPDRRSVSTITTFVYPQAEGCGASPFIAGVDPGGGTAEKLFIAVTGKNGGYANKV